jgi:hypothetical protein
MYNETISCSSHKLPLLLERVGVRRIKSISYIPIIPTFSLKGEGAGTCVDTYAQREAGLCVALPISDSITAVGFS